MPLLAERQHDAPEGLEAREAVDPRQALDRRQVAEVADQHPGDERHGDGQRDDDQAGERAVEAELTYMA